MWIISIKEGAKVILITLLATIVALIIQVIVSSSDGLTLVMDTLKDPNRIYDTIMAAFNTPISGVSVFVILIMMFAFSMSFLNSIGTVLGVGGVEVSAPKPRKEKKVKVKKEKKKEKAEEAPKPTEEPVIDTGNYCKMCGKPISLGRAICKECEAILRGEAPPSQEQPATGE